MIVDANVIVSALLGRSRTLLKATAARGVELFVTAAQLDEARHVLVGKLRQPAERTDLELAALLVSLRVLEPDTYAPAQAPARARLHARAQPDWPTLAAAITFGADIWSNDRDFFGAGVAVWSTRNIPHIEGVPA